MRRSLTATPSLAPCLRACLSRLARWAERQRQRRDLAELNDEALHDLGLTREQVRRECGKPFWR